MTQIDRRRLIALGAASLTLPAILEKAWAIDARVSAGNINDIDHIVILMQENRSFDHYFGAMKGVRGFSDRFPIPLQGGRTVWRQSYTKGEPREISPFPLNTTQTFGHIRIEGTPHNWADAQYAWDNGRMSNWPDQKQPHAMGYYAQSDIPFHWALAEAFTLCDAYHCSFQGGTNTNRLFHWTGTNDGEGRAGGPSISNSHDTLPDKAPLAREPYTWMTYPERLEAAGVSWKIYEDMADNFDDNPLVGFKAFRDSIAGLKGANPALAEKGHSTQHIDALRADVIAGRLPSVSWIIAPAKDSEHPGPSSPAQGADYIARVLDALTANPDVWGRTALLVNYDENDGFFDHVPPPAPPTRGSDGALLGWSSVDLSGEYHLKPDPADKSAERADLIGRPYGLGPRVPLFVISPFARGGWVNSEVFDHTSVIRFCEVRFGVVDPGISAWRRAVCGDLTSCFDFKNPNAPLPKLPPTSDAASRAAALPGRTKPSVPLMQSPPVQASGVRRSRPLGYNLRATAVSSAGLRLEISNEGSLGAVVHVYDCMRLDDGPHRFTVTPGRQAISEWAAGSYDLFVLGPNGFHRRFAGDSRRSEPALAILPMERKIRVVARNAGLTERRIVISHNAYGDRLKSWSASLSAGRRREHVVDLNATGGWYDFTVTCEGLEGYLARFAGRLDDRQFTTTDPALGGPALMQWAGA